MSNAQQAREEERERARRIFANPITQGANFKLAAMLYGSGLDEAEILEACEVATEGLRVAEFKAGAQSAAKLLGREPPRLDDAIIASAVAPARHAFSNRKGPFTKTERREFADGAESARHILSIAPH